MPPSIRSSRRRLPGAPGRNVITKHSLVGIVVGTGDGGLVAVGGAVGAGVNVGANVTVGTGVGTGVGAGDCVEVEVEVDVGTAVVGMGVGRNVGTSVGGADRVVVDVDVDVVGTRSSSVGMLVLVGSYVWAVGR